MFEQSPSNNRSPDSFCPPHRCPYMRCSIRAQARPYRQAVQVSRVARSAKNAANIAIVPSVLQGSSSSPHGQLPGASSMSNVNVPQRPGKVAPWPAHHRDQSMSLAGTLSQRQANPPHAARGRADTVPQVASASMASHSQTSKPANSIAHARKRSVDQGNLGADRNDQARSNDLWQHNGILTLPRCASNRHNEI